MDSNAPHGINITKRPVAKDAEDLLYKPAVLDLGQEIMLVDYQGGDMMVERAATKGLGLEIYEGEVSRQQLFEEMAYRASFGPMGMATPFRSTVIKMRVQTSVANSMYLVHQKEVNVNEESQRYSIPSDGLIETIAEDLSRINPGLGMTRAKEVVEMAHAVNTSAKEGYEALHGINSTLDLSREIARIILTVQQQTAFYIAVDLYTGAMIAKEGEIIGPTATGLTALSSHIKELLMSVAPEATTAIMRGGKHHNLRLRRDFDPATLRGLEERTWDAQETKRIVAQGLEEKLFVPREFGAKNNPTVGVLQAVDYLGDDSSIVQGARVSYGAGTKSTSEDASLIRFLRRHGHTSPFELAHNAQESFGPVFIDPRQKSRHRTIDNTVGLNGMIITSDDPYIPDVSYLEHQSVKNKQGRDGLLNEEEAKKVLEIFREKFDHQLLLEELMRSVGADERTIASVKGLGFKTRAYSTSEIHNWFHFLKLREDSHAQREIVDMASASRELIQAQVPIAYQSFYDYVKEAISFSRVEKELMKEHGVSKIDEELLVEEGTFVRNGRLNREGREFLAKLGQIR